MSRWLAILLLTVCVVRAAGAADDPKKAELLPPPRELPAETVIVPVEQFAPPMFIRQNRYDVWQAVGVNRWGYFRPRVAYSPDGSYYLYNGRPYPFDQVRPREWLMWEAGTPYRTPPAYMPYVHD